MGKELDPGSLVPAAIQFMLEHLQESARWSSNFCFLFSCICIQRTLESDLLSLSTPSGTIWLFFMMELMCVEEKAYMLCFESSPMGYI